MRYAVTSGVARRVLSRAATAYAAGLIAREHAEWCNKAGFRALTYRLTFNGQRVPPGSGDWVAFEAGRAGQPEPSPGYRFGRHV